MFDRSRFLLSRAQYAFGMLLLIAAVLGHCKAWAITWADTEGDFRRDIQPALGIYSTFGRWNRTVNLVYDPDNAPLRFQDAAHFKDLIEQAASQWEHVSGVSIDVLPPDTAIVNDRYLSFAQRDELVAVFWGVADSSFSARAGPIRGSFDPSLGYYPYYDGDIELSTAGTIVWTDAKLVRVLVHELGHLLGLGHSNDPNSVMYANPYNYMVRPRPDDIRAMQVLYGAPEVSISTEQPLREWVFQVPPVAPESVTRYLFKPNQSFGSTSSAFLSLSDNPSAPVTSITGTTSDDSFIRVNSGGIGNFNNTKDIDLTTTIVVVDPGGYVWDRYSWRLSCRAGSACGNSTYGFSRTRYLKTLPGLWKVFVLDESHGSDNATLLLAFNLQLQTPQIINKPPVATLAVEAGYAPGVARFVLTATDPELDDISVRWHSPGYAANSVNTMKSGGTVSQTIDFRSLSSRIFFIEVNDKAPRYDDSGENSGNAGSGFQTLLRVTVTLEPGATPVIAAVSSEPPFNESWTSQLPVAPSNVAAIASMEMPEVMTTNNSPTSARFKLGVSRDYGLSTATTFTAGNQVIVAGALYPQAADLGKAAEIYIVISNVLPNGAESWNYRGPDGYFRPWNGTVAQLQPALQVTSLASSQVAEIYQGTLAKGFYWVYIGYKLHNSSEPLHYTSRALLLQAI